MQPQLTCLSSDTHVHSWNSVPSNHNDNEPVVPTFDKHDKQDHVINGDAHTLPSAKQLAMRQGVHVNETTRHKLPEPPQLPCNIITTVRAQLHTGADATCTSIMEVLHDHRKHSKSFPCQVCLVSAIRKDSDKNSGVHPSGEGCLLHITATPPTGCVRV